MSGLDQPPGMVMAGPGTGSLVMVLAVVLAGGLWALYTTDLYRLMPASALLHVLVHAHILGTGYLLAFSLVGIDPNPHRASFTVRSIVLVVFMTAHSVLAKWVYAHPPAGVTAQDAHTGAQLMYDGGDLVDTTLIVLLFARWYRDTRPVGTRPRTLTRQRTHHG